MSIILLLQSCSYHSTPHVIFHVNLYVSKIFVHSCICSLWDILLLIDPSHSYSIYLKLFASFTVLLDHSSIFVSSFIGLSALTAHLFSYLFLSSPCLPSPTWGKCCF
ncbi:hypothetical protein L211DRAFT_344884 [Terfezia boudieri ATCC MYA-4762]|uniref:Uncharacterized protein n=1 Tax=Terfezia boudieri ATCC MYA-4762 TaxID=1051890 RepID=A0A3N4LLC5_9PEZI|nr:hypothetical protein L211DRAFT_344884 [Terfezia boudieri ATCC MYA-4762]